MGVIVDVLIVVVAIRFSTLLCWIAQRQGKKAKAGRP